VADSPSTIKRSAKATNRRIPKVQACRRTTKLKKKVRITSSWQYRQIDNDKIDDVFNADRMRRTHYLSRSSKEIVE